MYTSDYNTLNYHHSVVFSSCMFMEVFINKFIIMFSVGRYGETHHDDRAAILPALSPGRIWSQTCCVKYKKSVKEAGLSRLSTQKPRRWIGHHESRTVTGCANASGNIQDRDKACHGVSCTLSVLAGCLGARYTAQCCRSFVFVLSAKCRHLPHCLTSTLLERVLVLENDVFLLVLSLPFRTWSLALSRPLSLPQSPSMWPPSLSQGNSLAVGQVGQSCGGMQQNGITSEERQRLTQGPAGTTTSHSAE